MSALEEVLLNAYHGPDWIPDDPEQRERLQGQFRVETDDQADWALRKIAKIRQQKAQNAKTAEAEVARIQGWLRKEEEKLLREEGFFLSILQDYHSRILEKDPKRKTVSLPAGKIQIRAQQPEFRRDAQTLVVWLEAHGMTDFVKVKKEPDWAGFKTRVAVAGGGQVVDKETGEIVEGVTAEERPPKFDVEVS